MPRTYAPKAIVLTADGFRQWRLRQKLSRKQAASALGVAWVTVQRYEEGKKVIPKTVALACSAVSFGLPPMPSQWP